MKEVVNINMTDKTFGKLNVLMLSKQLDLVVN